MRRKILKHQSRLALLAALLCLVPAVPGCSGTSFSPGLDGAPSSRNIPGDLSRTPDAVPRIEPKSRYGNPSSYTVAGQTYRVRSTSQGYKEKGRASWYGTKFHGNRTSSGESYSMYKMTAAHKTLPIPCYVRVTNTSNGRAVIVRVNARGPFVHGRIIDLSYAAATKLGILSQGTAPVLVEAVGPGDTAYP